MTENSALAMQREALINELRNVDDIAVIQKHNATSTVPWRR